ncbi:hypothetical protein ACIRBX_11530 [Kitasatospora sp. NPDC096147]|uniref:hypothetical protein n=1 Tax=Kitasatospora sp. NPDC096147 TaxID=3364093 RepID=UPI0038228E26
MELRDGLLPPVIAADRVAELVREIERIEELAEGRAGEAEAAVAAFNARTGHEDRVSDFLVCGGSRSTEEFAREAAGPGEQQLRGLGLSRAEAVELVRRVMAGEDGAEHYLRVLTANVRHPGLAGLIFHPPPELSEAGAEEIAGAALGYRPIAL